MVNADLVVAVRGLLHSAVAKEAVAANAGPGAPSVDYLTGFAAGQLSGEVATWALVLSMMTAVPAHEVLVEARLLAEIPLDAFDPTGN